MWITGTFFFRCEELVPIFHKREELVPKPYMPCVLGLNSHNCEKMVSNRHMWKKCIKTLTCEELVPNFQTSVNLVPNYQRCEELTDTQLSQMAKAKLCKIGIESKMHQGLGVYSINLRNSHVCYMKFDFMRILHNMKDIGTEYVTYWYQFLTCCEIFRGKIFSTDSS